MEGTAAAHVAWHLLTSEIVRSTSTQSHSNTPRTFQLDQTYQDAPSYAGIGPTAIKARCVFPTSERPEDSIVAEILAFSNLQDGWDGEYASKPDPHAITRASNFIRLLGRNALRMEPTIHSDGSIILETEDGSAIRFIEDDQISVIFPRFTGIVSFDGMNIPLTITQALGV